MEIFQIIVNETIEQVNLTVEEPIEEVNITVSNAVAGISAYLDAVLSGIFTGTKEEWFASIKGNPFVFEDFTPEQLQMLKGLYWEDMTDAQKAELKGDPLRWQDLTEEQIAFLKGEDGKSNYEIAVDNGFPGSEEDWINFVYGPRFEFRVMQGMIQWHFLNDEEWYNLYSVPTITTGEKHSGVDAGNLGDRSYTIDAEYLCVLTGDETSAVWRMKLLEEA